MDTYFFYDTETTGLPLWREPSDSPGQPYIVQLAYLLTDGEGNKLAAMDTLLKPPLSGWVMEKKAFEKHGITEEHAAKNGIREEDVLEVFIQHWCESTLRVGFNEPFDARLVRIALMRHILPMDIHGHWKGGKSHCVMKQSKPICQMPPTAKMLAAGFNAFKPPKLSEAYQHFFGEPLDGAHDAMVDVNATARIFFHLKNEVED